MNEYIDSLNKFSEALKSCADALKKKEEQIPDIFLRKIDDIELTVRAYKGLKSNNINYIGDLVQKTENDLLRIPRFGRKSLREIKELLSYIGLELGMKIENWNPENIEKSLKTNNDLILEEIKELNPKLTQILKSLDYIKFKVSLLTKNDN